MGKDNGGGEEKFGEGPPGTSVARDFVGLKQREEGVCVKHEVDEEGLRRAGHMARYGRGATKNGGC